MGNLRERWSKLQDQLKAELFLSQGNPDRLAFALGFGVFLGIFPVWGLQTFLALTLAHLLRLNKVLVLTGSCVSLPPFLPFVLWASWGMGAWIAGNPEPATPPEDLRLMSASYQIVATYLLGAIPLSMLAGGMAFLVSRLAIWSVQRR